KCSNRDRCNGCDKCSSSDNSLSCGSSVRSQPTAQTHRVKPWVAVGQKCEAAAAAHEVNLFMGTGTSQPASLDQPECPYAARECSRDSSPCDFPCATPAIPPCKSASLIGYVDPFPGPGSPPGVACPTTARIGISGIPAADVRPVNSFKFTGITPGRI